MASFSAGTEADEAGGTMVLSVGWVTALPPQPDRAKVMRRAVDRAYRCFIRTSGKSSEELGVRS